MFVKVVNLIAGCEVLEWDKFFFILALCYAEWTVFYAQKGQETAALLRKLRVLSIDHSC